MKATVILFVGLFLLLPALSIGTAHALDIPAVNAEVPFDFYAGTKMMHAGKYNVTLDSENRNILIRSADGHDAAFVMATVVAEGSEQTQLVFDHIGDHYFLKTLDSSDRVLDFPVQQTEAKVASADTPQSDAVVALNGQ